MIYQQHFIHRDLICYQPVIQRLTACGVCNDVEVSDTVARLPPDATRQLQPGPVEDGNAAN